MKTIEEAATEYDESFETDMAFKAGVEFAQRWIPIEEELPEEKTIVLTKGIIGSMNKTVFIECAKLNIGGRFSNEFDWKIVTHWRQIELK